MSILVSPLTLSVLICVIVLEPVEDPRNTRFVRERLGDEVRDEG